MFFCVREIIELRGVVNLNGVLNKWDVKRFTLLIELNNQKVQTYTISKDF